MDINEAIRDVIVITRGEAAKNGISVEAQLAEALPAILGDRVQLQQVILNLIINAIEAMGGVAGPRELTHQDHEVRDRMTSWLQFRIPVQGSLRKP